MFSAAPRVRSHGLGLVLATVLAAALLAPASASPSPIEEIRPNPARVTLRSSGVSQPSRVAAKPIARGAQSAAFRVTYDAGFEANPRAKAAFQRAVDLWSTQITSDVPITVEASFAPLEPGVLGAAGATYNATIGGRRYPAALAAKLAGRDLVPRWPMIQAQFSSTAAWYYGTDGNTPADWSDFVSVVMHEIGHGLGFAGSGDVSGGLGSVSSPPEIYDVYVVDGAGLPTLSLAGNSVALGALFRGDNLYWDGANGVAGNGGARPKLYAPITWQGGSSYSHLDDDTYGPGNANSLMTPSINDGEAIHDPGPIARGMFQDMGWTIDAGGAATATPTAIAVVTPTPTPAMAPIPVPTIASGAVRSFLPLGARTGAP